MTELQTPGSQISLLLNKSLTQLVQSEIERQILSGEMQAGERLNEVALAQKLKVSRGPIREALRTLQEAGLVSFEKNRGAAVRVISPEEATDIYEVRAALEALACRRLAAKITPAIVAELAGFADRMAEAVEVSDVAAFNRLNIAFHERIMEHAGNRELAVTYRRLVGNLTLFRQRTLALEGSLAESNAEHRAIVARLAAADADRAAALMQQHIEESSQRTRLALKHHITTEESP
ncbi:MAG TPA: FCD domain-containing protein [Usitatibacter sp.]|nr:FCD domain-containing protein [Usitatibacter sp.]